VEFGASVSEASNVDGGHHPLVYLVFILSESIAGLFAGSSRAQAIRQ